jgi:hypothetical protein
MYFGLAASIGILLCGFFAARDDDPQNEGFGTMIAVSCFCFGGIGAILCIGFMVVRFGVL